MLLSYPLTSSNIFLHHSTIGEGVLQEKLTFWNVHFIFFQYGKAGSLEEEGAATASALLGNLPRKGIQEEPRGQMTIGPDQELTACSSCRNCSDPLGEELALPCPCLCLQSQESAVTRLSSKDQPQQRHPCVYGTSQFANHFVSFDPQNNPAIWKKNVAFYRWGSKPRLQIHS